MSENTKWFSQTLLTFKDKQYSTDSYLRVAISTNTDDYKFFNPPIFNVSITSSNNFQKSINLNIQNTEDLMESFDKLKQMSGNDLVLEKHYNKMSKLYFKFAVDANTQTQVVIMEIYSNDSDATKIIIPFKPTFQSFLKRLRYFVQNYDSICLQIFNQSINYESIQIIQQLPNLIKGISSQIVSRIPDEGLIQDSRVPPPEPEEFIPTEVNSLDFEKFLGDNMENIKIPEIEEEVIEKKQEAASIEINSPFIKNVLKNDLMNLESKLNSFAIANNPIADLANDLSLQLKFDVFNGVTPDDRKSICYLSKMMMDFYTQNYILNQVPIPDKTVTLKFPGEATDDRVELAKDLLTIIGYVRTVRRRLENKQSNPYENKSIFYILLRHMVDPFCFSYLQEFTHSQITSSILNRYECFEKAGLFDKYNEILKTSNCSPISKSDLNTFAGEVYDSIVKTPFVKDLHDRMNSSGHVRLPSKNTFNLEQIINEFVVVEVADKVGIDIKEKINNGFLKDKLISEEILNIFIKNKKIEKKSDIKIKKLTPLERVVEKFKQDIPEAYQSEVADYVKELQYNKFDFENCKWPLMEFDQRVVVAFYVWDVESDEKMKNNFAYFMSLVENEQMSKEDIIIATQKTNEEGKSFGFENLNFD